MTGRALGVGDSTQECKYVTLDYNANTVTQAIVVAQYPCRVSAINGRPRVAGSGGACTFDFYKCASAIAAASGTKLNTTTFDLTATADTNQLLAPGSGLVADADSRTLQLGDSINVLLTGTPTSAVGVVTVVLDPL
jgi:hypothetical protein